MKKTDNPSKKKTNNSAARTMASPDAKSCAVGFSMNVGSRFGKASEAGASHFLEHMLFKESAKRPTAARINRTLDRMVRICDFDVSVGF